MTDQYTVDIEFRIAKQTKALIKRVRKKYEPWGTHQYHLIPYYSDRRKYHDTIKGPETELVLGSEEEKKKKPATEEPRPKRNEYRLIELMENRTNVEDGLTIKELCKEIFDYKLEHKYKDKIQWTWRCVHIIPGINEHLQTPILNRLYKTVDSMSKHIEERKKAVDMPWEEREAMIRDTEAWYENNEERAKVLARELRRRRRLPRKRSSHS
jgi:hypothetical protein